MNVTEMEHKLTELYSEFMRKMNISHKEGFLGRIDNNRYVNESLRFSGYPYIGAEYYNAKKKILFVGLDTGIDELREENTYHSIR